ncbi:aspartyl protease family protein [uncultured Tenacibaculum sp.]|uniref:aspartyl protease family protein n=1 Tax=uncultured Tenacibaculum sp. TaxID=174713 RepID=UPI002635671F|nr:aspartyl protease family protein [uncultured Tenacibaculum sp.]
MFKIVPIIFFLLICTSSFSTNEDEIVINSIPIRFKNAKIINEHSTRIPFKLVDRLIVIEGTIKDKKGQFIIDTGSETMLLNKVHFKTYTFEEKQETTTGVIDFVDDIFEKRIKKMSLKEMTLHNKRSDIIDLSHIEKSKKIKLLGIIGFSVLKDYEVFIDLYLNQITLTKIDAYGNTLNKKVYLEKIVDSLNFKLKKHTIVLSGYIGKEKITFGLDSGAEFNQISKRVHKNVLQHFYPKKRVKLVGASKRSIEALYGNLFRVKLSDQIYFGPMKTILTNLNNMNKAFGTNLDVVLGHDFFLQKRVIINYKKEKLYFINYPLIRK